MSFIQDAWDSLRGKSTLRRAEESQLAANQAAIEEQRRASEQALGFFEQFQPITDRALGLSSFLADPNAQFEFLQNNPLFQAALENANTQTMQAAAARGRVSAGDTMSQLSQNILLAAQPLIDRQRQDIGNLLNLGSGMAQSQANVAIGEGANVSQLLGNVGNIQAAQDIGSFNQTMELLGGIGQVFGGLLGLSDNRLKKNIKKVGVQNGYDVYEWEWNSEAKEKFGLEGKQKGVMYNDVAQKNPDAALQIDGYGAVDYGKIGVSI